MHEGDARQAAQDGPEDQSRQRDKLMGQRGRHACLNVLQLRRSNQMGQDDEDQTCNRGRRRTRKKLRPRPPVGPRSKLMRESPNALLWNGDGGFCAKVENRTTPKI